ncbi:transcription initiation factor TFIID subunit 2-like isoform X4 [Lotus japonicus]|uniref:transcription initiation factor TFIID subunit 2-like isoform X4 n=1 Tax=Lotus japonicus TaxID=34305 RepID=UPI002585E91A|nr:transcription initiation factor TFIID subunit 2-like isoform X4 [Lotus japonicus]
MRMGFSYNKRKNMVELAVLRECTVLQTSSISVLDINPDSEHKDGDTGWPGMMSIWVYELDSMYDHPNLPMAGEAWQLLEIQCHSRLAARCFQKPKKGLKFDGSDDNGDLPSMDIRSSIKSLYYGTVQILTQEYLAEVHFNQPVQMWVRLINWKRTKMLLLRHKQLQLLKHHPGHRFLL